MNCENLPYLALLALLYCHKTINMTELLGLTTVMSLKSSDFCNGATGINDFNNGRNCN